MSIQKKHIAINKNDEPKLSLAQEHSDSCDNFTNLQNVVFNKVSPKDYKLFQAADYVCTFRLLKEKLDKDCLTKSDLKFFSGKRELKKTYLAPLLTKTFL